MNCKTVRKLPLMLPTSETVAMLANRMIKVRVHDPYMSFEMQGEKITLPSDWSENQ